MASSASRRVWAPCRYPAPASGSRPQALEVIASNYTCGSRSLLQPAPPPTSAGGVYFCLCFWLFLFHFSFCPSWDSPIGRRLGKSQLTRTLATVEAPSPVLATVARLQGDHPASRSPWRYELSSSALGREMVVPDSAMEFSPKAHAPGPSQLRLHSRFSSTSRSRAAPPT